MAKTLDDLKTRRIKDAASQRREAHANVQFEYRNRMRQRNAPDREDFGRAALTVVLLLCRDSEAREFADALRRSVTSRLAYVGFDRAEAEALFAKMLARAPDDAEAWKRYRDWQQAR